MSSGMRWSASAVTLAAAAWGLYYAIMVPATAHSLESYVNAQACGYEQGQWVKTDHFSFGDNHLRAIGFARLTIVCASQPKLIEDYEKRAIPEVLTMAKQPDIRAEALEQVKKAYP